MPQDPYYWHYRCLASLVPFRADDIKVTQEQAEAIPFGKVAPPKFTCQFCGQEGLRSLASVMGRNHEALGSN